MLFAAFLGGAILHLRGHYFAIASLIVAEMLREIVNTHAGFHRRRQRPQSADPAHLGRRRQAQFFFYAMLALALVCTAATAIVIHRSKLGFGCAASSRTRTPPDILGVNAYAYKTAAFSLSAVFVGMAGAIYASWVNYIEPPDVFDVLLSVKPMVMVLLGGLGTIFGPALGAVILLRVRGSWSGAISSPSMRRRSVSSSWCCAVPAERHAGADAANWLPAQGSRE